MAWSGGDNARRRLDPNLSTPTQCQYHFIIWIMKEVRGNTHIVLFDSYDSFIKIQLNRKLLYMQRVSLDSWGYKIFSLLNAILYPVSVMGGRKGIFLKLLSNHIISELENVILTSVLLKIYVQGINLSISIFIPHLS